MDMQEIGRADHGLVLSASG